MLRRWRWSERVGLLAFASLVAAGQGALAGDRLAWSLVDEATPHFAWVGAPFEVSVRVRNEGTATWRPELLDNISYHWLTTTGETVQRDGRRTRVPGPVPPGGEVDAVVVVDPVPVAGARVLEWAMVRENVAWFPAPRSGGNAQVAIVVLWRVSVGVVALSLAIALAAALLRTRRRPGSAWWWGLATGLPALFVGVAAWIATTGFAELSGLALWKEERALHLGGAALLALTALLAPGRSRVWASTGLIACLTVVATADLLYMRWFGTLVPLAAVAAAHQVVRVGGSVHALYASGFVWMTLLIVPAVATAGMWPRWRTAEAPSRRFRVAVVASLAALCALAVMPVVHGVAWSLRDPASSRLIFSQQHRVRQWGLVDLHLLDGLLQLRRVVGRTSLAPEDRHRAVELFSRRAASAPAAGPLFGAERGRNLLLIQVESLQEWVVDARVRGQPVMPTLSELRHGGDALYFSSVFDQSAQGRSSDGEFAALTSMLPLRTGAVAFLYADDHFLALPGVLREQGYATMSAHPFERGFWNRAVLHPRYGFERSLFQRDLGPGDTIGWGLADGVFFARALEHVERLQRPFYAHLITLGLHHPFDLFPARHKILDVGDLESTPLGNYLHAMHYFDASFAELLAALRRSGLAASTVVALYGDHESGLGIDDGLIRVAGLPGWDVSLPARLRRIPFLVLLPGESSGIEVGEVGGHVDIAPTLLYLLGVERPRSFLGTVLMPGRGGVTAQADGSAIGDGLIYVSRGPSIPDEGACFSYPEGVPRKLTECRSLADCAKEQFDAAELVIEHDLFRVLAGSGGH